MNELNKQNFVDFVQISVKAGDGGQGCISFLRDRGKPFGGPNGGDGGRGGSIIVQGEREMTTLLDFKTRPRFIAPRGEHGAGKQCSGKGGEDMILKVPLGTTIIDMKTKEVLGDILSHGQQLVVAKGGDGGRGNQHFHSATNKAPRKAEAGWPGEERVIGLELRIIAEAGLVGLPNAGKSTLLSKLTSANPKIAPYPFTTISPNLGVFLSSDLQQRITLADIPGLIEGAHEGAGLGDRFLRHIERTRVLVHLVAPEAGTTEEGDLTSADASAETLLYAFRLVEAELSQYDANLLLKPRIVCLSKIDLMTEEEVQAALAAFKAEGIELLPISAEAGIGLEELKARIEAIVVEMREEPKPELPEPPPDDFFAPTTDQPEIP
jgi:GTP-binding protein